MDNNDLGITNTDVDELLASEPHMLTPEEMSEHEKYEREKQQRISYRQETIKNDIKKYNDSSKKQTKDDKNIVKTSYFETPDSILEQVKIGTDGTHGTHYIVGSDNKFYIYNKKSGLGEIIDNFQYEGKTYYPIVDDILMMNGIQLPSGVEEYLSTKEITDEIHEFIKNNIELPEFYEKFLPNLILFYWVYEQFPFVPYVQFVGRTGTGKSTAMEVFGSLCYKPIDTTGSLTIASVFRVATQWKGTLLIDEFEKAGENSKEMVSFLKSGVSNNLVLRTEGEIKKEVKAYVVKAPKLFTSENPINDAGLQSRTMVIKMEKNKKALPLFRLPHYYEEAMHIRNKLLLWRLRNLNNIDLSKIEYGFPELRVFDRRVQQVITPIFYFSDDETKENILKFAEEQEAETKRERRESQHGAIFEAILGLIGEVPVTITAISEEVNPKNAKYPISNKRIASIIRKILGFEIERAGRGNEKESVVILEDSKVQELCLYYGILPPVQCVPSVPSVPKVDSNISEDIIPKENTKPLDDDPPPIPF